jgi:glycine/D-amino acid oxidase-like deaminating enzyme
MQVQRAMYGAVDEVGCVAQEEDLDIDFQKGGSLRLARGPHQLPAIQESYESYKELGLEDHYELLDEQETAQRIRVTKALGSLYSPDTAVIHPGKLVRGLARTIERMGGTIYEQTAVTDFTTGAYPALHSKQGNVRARNIALCGEAYLSQLRKVGRQVMPMYSLITLTEPLSQSDWELIGWEHRECVASSRYTIDYLSKTADGRVLFGGRGAPYHFRSRMDDAYDRHPATHRMRLDGHGTSCRPCRSTRERTWP